MTLARAGNSTADLEPARLRAEAARFRTMAADVDAELARSLHMLPDEFVEEGRARFRSHATLQTLQRRVPSASPR